MELSGVLMGGMWWGVGIFAVNLAAVYRVVSLMLARKLCQWLHF